MGGVCSTPHIDTTEPPLEILVLSDGCSTDAALVEFLTQPGWLAASSVLQRRLPPRQPHKLPPPITITTHSSLSRRKSSRSEGAGGSGSSGSVHPAPQPASTTASANSSPSTSPTLSPNPSNSPPSSSPSSTIASNPSSSLSPTPPLLYFLCDTHPISVRFHTCPDYSALTRRRASTLAKQARPGAHSRRPSASSHMTQPIHSTAPLDGAIVFLSTRDALVAGSVLIAGIRPMLKRRPKENKVVGVGLGGVGAEKGRPVVGRVGAEGNMLPFVVVGVDEEGKEDETRTTTDNSQQQQQKSGGRIVVQPRSTSDNDTTRHDTTDNTHQRTPSPKSDNSLHTPTPIPGASPSPPPTATPPQPDNGQKRLSRQRGSLSENSEGRSSTSVTERPNSSTVVIARKLGLDEGKGLAVDSGAVGYSAVDVKTGKAMDAALKQLVLAIRKDRQLRGKQHVARPLSRNTRQKIIMFR